MKRLAAVLCLALVAGQPSVAASWRASEKAGRLTFEATQAAARFTGEFSRFVADIAFDPTAPAECQFDVTIDTASARTGESQRDGLLRGQDFFWVDRYPNASYQGSACRSEGAGFTLNGQMLLRGIARPVTLEFDFEPGPGGGGRLTGKAVVQRLDFGVGQGEWEGTEWVGSEVTVRFDLTLSAAAAKAE